MKWATRKGCHVDRAACAWLIRRFIDGDATFTFVDDPDEIPHDATPFDLRGAELSNHGGACTFEAFLMQYALDEPALRRLAMLVHEADLSDEVYDAPEAAGLDVVIRGLSMIQSDDDLLETCAPVFDGLYEYYRRATLLERSST